MRVLSSDLGSSESSDRVLGSGSDDSDDLISTNPTILQQRISLVFVFAESENTKIMFAGPGVIKRTIGEDLPSGFQTAGYLLKKGFVDRIIHRKNHREELSNLLSILLNLEIKKAEDTTDAAEQNTVSPQQIISA